MFNKKFVKGITIASTIFVLTGCGANGLNGIDDPNKNGNNDNLVNQGNTDSTLSTLKFSKVTEQKSAEYNSLIARNAASATNNSAPNPTAPAQDAAAPLVAARGEAKASSGMIAAPVSYFPYPGVFEEYVVIDFEEAKTAGFTGTYLQALTKIVKPIIKSLGSDARMVNSNGSSDDNGLNKSQQAEPAQNAQKPMYYPGYQQYQWQFTFVSSSKKEVYNIYISSSETLVLKQVWGLRDLTPDNIKIDSSEAIKAVINAIKDKSFTAPDNQPVYMSPEAEVLYDIPPNTSWYLYLEKEKGNLVWNINMNINTNIVYYGIPERAVMATDTVTASGSGSADASTTNAGTTSPDAQPIKAPDFWYSGGYAKVDAVTGKVLSLVRPMKYHVVNPPPCCKTDPAQPMPMPAVIAETKT